MSDISETLHKFEYQQLNLISLNCILYHIIISASTNCQHLITTCVNHIQKLTKSMNSEKQNNREEIRGLKLKLQQIENMC